MCSKLLISGGGSLTSTSRTSSVSGVIVAYDPGTITVSGAGSKLRGVNTAGDAGIMANGAIKAMIANPINGVFGKGYDSHVGIIGNTVLTAPGGSVVSDATLVSLPDAPKTGDSAAPWLWIGLALVAGEVLAACAVAKRRASKRR